MNDESEDDRQSRRRFLKLAGVSAVGMAGCNSDDSEETETLELRHGVAVGDVTDDTAVFWSRLEDSGVVHVEYATDGFEKTTTHEETVVDGDADNTARIRLEGLNSGTEYRYRAWGTPGSGGAARNAPVGSEYLEEGVFKTAPAPDERDSVTIAWSGDTYGYGGYPLEPPFECLRSIGELGPDAFLYLGDTIYADANTPAGVLTGDETKEEAMEIYRAKYKEMRVPDESVAETTHLQKALTSTSVYAIWDDHEVENNFDRTHRLLSTGRDVFIDYWPIDRHESVTGDVTGRLFRKFQWGEHLELFILDTRQYKSPKDGNTDSKTMLSRPQIEWLKQSLRESDATVKIIGSSVTFGINSGDGWTSGGDPGYKQERDEIVEMIRSESIKNVVVLSGDVHTAAVATYDLGSVSDVNIVESSAGAMGAPSGGPKGHDWELQPRSHFERGVDLLNYGVFEVDEAGERFIIQIHNENGKEVYRKSWSTG
ncbi:MAG: alkaline phosphatase [Halobacteriales archaeon]